MKSKKKIIYLIGALFFCFILSSIIKKTYATQETEYKIFSRKELQEMIVATSLSYLYNNNYLDYEQKGMDSSSTFNWRTFEQSPEMVSRSNRYYIDCSSFVASIFIHSIGYDFSDYYKLSGSKIYHNQEYVYAYDGVDNFEAAYKYYGKGINTKFFADIGKNVSNVSAGTEYINNTKNENIVKYFYEVTGSETSTKKNTVENNILTSLEPGDLVIYRRVKTDGSVNGHVMLYVGDTFDSNGGFIHAAGSDYDFSTSPITIGNDDYSVRYDNIKKLKNNIFSTTTNNTSKSGASFTILRPINKYCINDECKIPVCSERDCGLGYLNNNVEARKDLKELRVEQYTKISKSYNDNLTANQEIKTVSKTISKYNSVNVGDTIRYGLYVNNKSIMNYCTTGNYTTQKECEENNYEWKQKSTTGRSYNNLTIIGQIPENTKFTGNCSSTIACSYDEKTNAVVWNIEKLSNQANLTFWYEVEIVNEKDVTNEGMKIKTEEGNTLQLATITTKVTPTINGINIDLFKKEVEKFTKLYEEGKITYDSSTAAAYTKDLDEITSINISQTGFTKMIYYNALGIDLGYIKASSIRNAIFDNVDSQYYTKKKDSDISKITDETTININKMLVKGMYGGRLLRADENRDRAQFIRTSDLEVGDIIVYLYNNATNISTYMFYGLDDDGNSIFIRFESSSGVKIYNNSTSKTGFRFFKEVYSQDLFVVLRPTQLYGTTVNYEYNKATTQGDNSYVAYNIYRNLNTPTKADTTINLEYNNELVENVEKEFKIIHKFEGWYSDSDLINKITNNTKLKTTSNHTVYARWDSTTLTLPNLTDNDGNSIEGWYSDKNLQNKVGNPGTNYTNLSNITLYAKWSSDTSTTIDEVKIDNTNMIISINNLKYTFNGLIELISNDTKTPICLDENNTELTETSTIKTGYSIKLDDETKYQLAVIGDTTGDGEINIADVAKTYQYLKNKITMDKIYQVSGDVTYDNQILINDIAKIYSYVKGKITTLK